MNNNPTDALIIDPKPLSKELRQAISGFTPPDHLELNPFEIEINTDHGHENN